MLTDFKFYSQVLFSMQLNISINLGQGNRIESRYGLTHIQLIKKMNESMRKKGVETT